ncbi:tetratricopeptide repeat protein [Mucilaginibacter sp. RS28]|uniref:Tetratricopeptide repeat protein n=1 Tax=Mucilaginibacter straminoryzae TaxID=2932774 RepID=A0A9X2BEG6_9SPHI|nr:tetratricopeptide repeat protein [Mucilaginibacter straminoryzae]MCJ8211383.1 tetratricopeptide repeat protein [Mucilaginibacter straminoryzae]
MSNTQANTKVENNQKTDFVQTGKFVRENQKSLLFIVGAVLALIVIYFVYQKVYLAPRETKAADQMHVAQDFWNKHDWDKAIKGDAGYPGFEKIVAEYSNTKAANLAYYYLGVAYLNKGEYRKAIDSFTNFRGDDGMLAAEALGSTGDAYVELKDYDKAATYFKKASDKANNKFLSPFYLKKLGLVYEAQKDNKSALEAYKKIKTDYSESTEGQNIDEYIARVEAKI